MVEPILKIDIPEENKEEFLYSREWLVTNHLGGYASGTLLGLSSRRYHGHFVPNLPAPRGRTMLIPQFDEIVVAGDQTVSLNTMELVDRTLVGEGYKHLKQFRLEWQIPIWIYEMHGRTVEKRIVMPYGQNTVYIQYRLIKGEPIEIKLRPYLTCRQHEGPLGHPLEWPFTMTITHGRYEIHPFDGAPFLRIGLQPAHGVFVCDNRVVHKIFYREEYDRGHDHSESLSSPGYFATTIKEGECVSFIASTENWEMLATATETIFEAEVQRKKKMLASAPLAANNILTSQLVMAADQFVILPQTRAEENFILSASGEHVRTVIAGYHWFTDWGRDTMISLEGLTLSTGRFDEAKAILQTFAHYIKDGLLPNHFPEGHRTAIYNTVDATFWYFHAIDRYYRKTKDKELLNYLYPYLRSVIDAHVRGTHYGIHMDPSDSLIQAAADGYQLTWMDAKVDEWVVTPRRGKPVEIQALWFNALKLMETWSRILGKPREVYIALSERVFESFNSRFWYHKGQYCYDVLDSGKGHDAALRPNQILAISLRFPVLDKDLWKPVIDTVANKLLTPYGLRSLAPEHKDYHARYEGNRWSRDAAYHQGLVWTWLLGHFIDAFQKVYADGKKAKAMLASFEQHLTDAGIGSISEIFDAEPPYKPRACIAQAWSVAEILRIALKLQTTEELPLLELKKEDTGSGSSPEKAGDKDN